MLEKHVLEELPDNELLCFIRLYSDTHQGDIPYKYDYMGNVIVLNRGEVVKSLSKLEQKWNLSRDKVRRMLNKWEKSGIINKKVIGKGKNSITVISMYNIKEVKSHNKPQIKESKNKDINLNEDHNKPQQNKELNNKELNKGTKLLNPEVFEFGLIQFNEIREYLIEEGFIVPPMMMGDFFIPHRQELIDVFSSRYSKHTAVAQLFLYAYIRELNRIYLIDSGARYWTMRDDDFENISAIMELVSDFPTALNMVTEIFERVLELDNIPRYVSTSYFITIIEKMCDG
ncbi:hypothetical protein E9993_04870 [Labilibacter sediminis]|nr:hypothetical protein E9993_04870 [Labilibacter sediminis]